VALLIATPDRDSDELARHIRDRDPDIDLRVWPDPGRTEDIRFALVWKPPPGLFEHLPALQAISSLGAGVDALVENPEIPSDVAIGRLAGPRLAANMAAYLVSVVVARWKRLTGFIEDQRRHRWNQWAPEQPPVIGILGTGEMGRRTAAAFVELDFPVHGYSRSGRGPDGVSMHSGVKGLHEIANASDCLINLLPLTSQTRDILDAVLFARMREGSMLINVGRGQHLVEEDLLEALEDNRPGFAVLDVFRTEPLPQDHPFWDHPRIFITPHCASITLTQEAAELAVESYHRVLAGKPPLGRVEREKGY